MTSFVIDTGNDILRHLPDHFLDAHPENPDRERVVYLYTMSLISEMNNPKMLATTRNHVLARWWFLKQLAEEYPETFDEFWCAYAERVLCI